jgi:hypothetical protein
VQQSALLAALAACAAATLVAVRNGPLDVGAVIVLVGALLLFVRAAFRLVDELGPREPRDE